MKTYIALLRGINVGGNNIIKMADLRECLTKEGFSNVQTYIQSGNVILQSDEEDKDKLLNRIQAALNGTFDYQYPVVLIRFDELERVISDAPSGYGNDLENFKYDVLYLKPPLTAAEAIDEIPVRENVDLAWEGPGVIYYRRTAEHLTKSMLNKLPSKPVYQQMTIRNWRTTNKIFTIAKEFSS
ncbi:MAG: DUF1697 domain-containing protein [Balneolaceae bacterium]|nr:DUF1697 domain-containing protein [Balneolaceae bacterium]